MCIPVLHFHDCKNDAHKKSLQNQLVVKIKASTAVDVSEIVEKLNFIQSKKATTIGKLLNMNVFFLLIYQR